jgi:hypothetical protein
MCKNNKMLVADVDYLAIILIPPAKSHISRFENTCFCLIMALFLCATYFLFRIFDGEAKYLPYITVIMLQ